MVMWLYMYNKGVYDPFIEPKFTKSLSASVLFINLTKAPHAPR